MSRLMLGKLPLSDVQRLRDELEKRLAGDDGEKWFRESKRFVRKESCWIPHWREQNGVIYFSVTSDGTTGEDWIKRLEKKGFRLSNLSKRELLLPDFKPTNGVTTEVAVLKGMLFEGNDRITKKIRAEADRRNLTAPNAEVACLICEMLSDGELEAIGLSLIVAMHEPFKSRNSGSNLLGVRGFDDGRWLFTLCDDPSCGWSREDGFAFAVPSSSACS